MILLVLEKVDKINADKLKTIPIDLNKLSDLVKSVVVKTVYDKLVKTLMLFRLLIVVIYLKKLTTT